jgi:hypothetical protein
VGRKPNEALLMRWIKNDVANGKVNS